MFLMIEQVPFPESSYVSIVWESKTQQLTTILNIVSHKNHTNKSPGIFYFVTLNFLIFIE